jgi:hypothetical protein
MSATVKGSGAMLDAAQDTLGVDIAALTCVSSDIATTISRARACKSDALPACRSASKPGIPGKLRRR